MNYQKLLINHSLIFYLNFLFATLTLCVFIEYYSKKYVSAEKYKLGCQNFFSNFTVIFS